MVLALAVRPSAKKNRVAVEFLECPDAMSWEHYRDVMARGQAIFDKAEDTFLIKDEQLSIVVQALRGYGMEVVIDSALVGKMPATVAVVGPHKPSEHIADVVDSRTTTVTPMPFQREGIEWLASRHKAALFDDPGLGKTIELALALPKKSEFNGAIVVCPAGLKYNWRDELNRCRPEFKTTVLSGKASFRWPRENEIIILNYDIMPDWRVFPVSPSELVLIADEAHNLRNVSTIRTQRWRTLKNTVRAAKGRVWIATGTEMLNRPTELWNILQAADLHVDAFGDWPRYVYLFGGVDRARVEKKVDPNTGKTTQYTRGGAGRFKWPPTEVLLARMNRGEIVKRLRSVSIKRLKRDVLKDLPAKSYKWVTVDIDKDTKIQCDRTLFALKEQGIDLEDAKQVIELTKIRGAAFDMMSKTRAALAVAKTGAMVEIVSDYEVEEEPLIVFCAHRAPIDALAKRPGWVAITGDTSPLDRKRIMDEFQAGKYKGIAGTIGAMGTGLTLTKSATVVFVDLDWVPDLNKQAEDRACRFGQTRGVVVIRIVANHPVDRRVLEILADKQELIEATTEAAAIKEGELVGAQEEASNG